MFGTLLIVSSACRTTNADSAAESRTCVNLVKYTTPVLFRSRTSQHIAQCFSTTIHIGPPHTWLKSSNHLSNMHTRTVKTGVNMGDTINIVRSTAAVQSTVRPLRVLPRQTKAGTACQTVPTDHTLSHSTGLHHHSDLKAVRGQPQHMADAHGSHARALRTR